MVKHNKNRRSSKVSIIKHSNKRYSKLLKQGKIKKSTLKLNRGAASTLHPSSKNLRLAKEKDDASLSHSEEDVDVLDMLDEKKDSSECLDNTLLATTTEDVAYSFEAVPRQFQTSEKFWNLKPLLPIKQKSKVIPQYSSVTDNNKTADGPVNGSTVNVSEEVDNVSDPIQDCDFKQESLLQFKIRIAKLASAVVEDPIENIKCIKDLREMLTEPQFLMSFVKHKLVVLSLLEVFQDIIPSYKIRVRSEEERKIKLKKETLKTVIFEETLITQYKAYLQLLEAMAKQVTKGKRSKRCSNGEKVIYMKLGELAVNCLCELLLAHPDFNFSQNIVATLVSLTVSANENIVDRCCNTLHLMFRRDKLGSISLEAVKQISKLLKSHSYNISPKLLQTFLYLRLNNVSSVSDEKTREKKLSHKEKKMRMSRREIKREKEMNTLQRELLEASAEESLEKKISFQTNIIKQVFNVYFNVLKKSPSSAVLSMVLEGLAKYAQLINYSFFDDMVSVLHQHLESDILTLRQSLHCIQLVFSILSGPGNVLHIDPHRFYTQFYKNMFQLHAEEDLKVAHSCLYLMISKRKNKVTQSRLLAFTKRLCTLSLHLTHGGTIATLALIRQFLKTHKQIDVLLDSDNTVGGGMYLPDLDDPEYCNANATSLWELHLLKSHYHPVVRHFSTDITVGESYENGLPLNQSRLLPEDLLEMYSIDKTDFNIENCQRLKKKSVKKGPWKAVNRNFYQQMAETMENVNVKQTGF